MIGDARVHGGLVLAAVLVGSGLALALLLPHERAVGFGVIFGGWALLVLALVRAGVPRRIGRG